MPPYRKKPVVIEAEKLTWENWNAVCELLGAENMGKGKAHGVWVDPKTGEYSIGPMPPPFLSMDDAEIGLVIPTLEGEMLARQGDYVIKGVKGEFYPCKPDIFEQTYERVAEGANL